MDKFGIFKLLNSFYDFYSKNKPITNENKPSEKTETTISPKKVNVPHPPLQQSMLTTMSSHDELVKRVMNSQKNKAPK